MKISKESEWTQFVEQELERMKMNLDVRLENELIDEEQIEDLKEDQNRLN